MSLLFIKAREAFGKDAERMKPTGSYSDPKKEKHKQLKKRAQLSCALFYEFISINLQSISTFQEAPAHASAPYPQFFPDRQNARVPN